jgi:hypothetical protein
MDLQNKKKNKSMAMLKKDESPFLVELTFDDDAFMTFCWKPLINPFYPWANL